MSWLNWLWSLLPDKCEMALCSRAGVRGNENLIYGLIVCDYCHAEMLPSPSKKKAMPSSRGEGREC